MEVKKCKQCGELKPITQFRKYYGNRKGTYTMCKDCERINSRKKYLDAKPEHSMVEIEELAKIEALYEYQRKLGLQPPTKQERRASLSTDLDSMLDKYRQMSEAVVDSTVVVTCDLTGVPHELTEWLIKDLVNDPDYYLDEIYDSLLETYRPCIGIDRESMMPIYDNKYKEVLDSILARFNEYEDSYYEGDE